MDLVQIDLFRKIYAKSVLSSQIIEAVIFDNAVILVSDVVIMVICHNKINNSYY